MIPERVYEENLAVTNAPTRKKSKSMPALKSKTKAAPSAIAAGKEAKKIYNETLKAADERFSNLDKKVKTMSGNSKSISTARYATFAGKHIKTATKLAAMDTTLGFNILLSLADASHTDLDASCKMCGTPCDSSIPTFTALDAALLPLIEERERHPQPRDNVLRSVPALWTRANADVGPYKTGRPNKQQWGQIYNQKLVWEKSHIVARRTRKEAVEEWVNVALSDLKEERDCLHEYGVEEYLPHGIARLEELAAEWYIEETCQFVKMLRDTWPAEIKTGLMLEESDTIHEHS